MKKLQFLLVLLFTTNFLNAQENCEKQQILSEELNSINKCFINHTTKEAPKKTSRKLKINAPVTKKRFLTVRKRTAAYSLLKNMRTKGINTSEVNNFINTESLIALRKEYKSVLNFTEVDQIPTFKSCKKATTHHEKSACFNSEMMQFLNDKIEDSDELYEEEFSGDIAIKFVIDTNGKTNTIQASGHKDARITKEVIIDIIADLPTLKPAIKNNEEVPVEYQFVVKFN